MSYVDRQYYVYIMASASNSVLYIGVTNNLARRVAEHKGKRNPGSFTAQYSVHKLVYYECGSSILEMIAREKQLKGWSRVKKETLIAEMNPEFRDLSDVLIN